MSGFDNEVLYADNVDFRGVKPISGQMTSDGQLLIGSSSSPYIRASTLSSSSSSIEVTNGAGTINLEFGPATAHSLIIGTGAGGFNEVLPSSTSGVPLVSTGLSSDPAFGTATVPGGGTGKPSFTSYGVVCGGTSGTSPLQQVSGTGTSGYVLTSNGASSLPSWQAASGGGAPYADLYWKATDFDALETNFAPLTQDNGTTVNAFVRAFDDTTTEYVNFSFQVPTDIDTSGTVTFRVSMYAATAAASKVVALTFDHRALSNSEAIDSSYTSEASGDISIDATQDDITIATWTETVSNLAWAASDFVFARLSRTSPSGTNLTGDLYVLGFEVSIPRA